MDVLSERAVVGAYRLASAATRRLPGVLADAVPGVAGPLVAALAGQRRHMLRRHLARVLGPRADDRALDLAVRAALVSYARYYVESFRLPDRTPDELAEGMRTQGIEALWSALDAGRGAILALPHLGGWEWAGAWLSAARGAQVTVVVEPLSPPALFEWFADLRSSLGMNIIPLGPDVAGKALRALADNHVVCLLCDRDLQGTGVEVPFFGEVTRLPAGPALLGLRSGAPVMPTAVYLLEGGRHLGLVRPPLDTTRRGRLRADIERVTVQLAGELEHLIGAAPHQWHLLQPNWPSDHLPPATSRQPPAAGHTGAEADLHASMPRSATPG